MGGVDEVLEFLRFGKDYDHHAEHYLLGWGKRKNKQNRPQRNG